MRYSLIVVGALLALTGAVLLLSREKTPQVEPGPKNGVGEQHAEARVEQPEAAPTSTSPDRGMGSNQQKAVPGGPNVRAADLNEMRKRLSEQEQESIVPRESRSARQQLQAFLDDAAANQKLTENIMLALKALAEEGNDPTAALREEYRRSAGGVQRASVVILALKELGTPKAKEALIEIAMNPGTDGYTLGARAVEAYAATGAGASDLARFLDSKEPQARDVAIQKMAGLPLGGLTLEKLGGQLNSKSWVTRNLVASAFGSDPQANTAEDKVRMLMSSSQTLNDLEAAEQILAQYGYTSRELALGMYASSMCAMAGATNALWPYLSSNNDTQRSLAAIALARRGEKLARDPVVRVVREADDGFLKTMAVLALGNLATAQDKTLLEDLARTDPYKRPSPKTEGEWRFPVREAAQRVLEMMNKQ